jgi:RNA polymerase sigma factor (sigma-70 family)
MGRPCIVRDEVASAYERLKPPVLRRSRRWFPTLSEADLEDLYQAAWLSVVRTDSEVRDLEDYLYAAVRSQGLMELRRRRRRPAIALSDLESASTGEADRSGAESAVGEPVDELAVSPEEQAETRAMAAWARDLLEELSPRQRAVVKLRWGWGLSRREIARLLGISEKAVKRDLELSGRRLSESVQDLHAGRRHRVRLGALEPDAGRAGGSASACLPDLSRAGPRVASPCPRSRGRRPGAAAGGAVGAVTAGSADCGA